MAGLCFGSVNNWLGGNPDVHVHLADTNNCRNAFGGGGAENSRGKEAVLIRVYEGPEFVATRDFHYTNDGVKDGEPAKMVKEGKARRIMPGWRHFFYIDDKHPKDVRCAISTPRGARELAIKSGFEFHPAGTWEPAQQELTLQPV